METKIKTAMDHMNFYNLLFILAKRVIHATYSYECDSGYKPLIKEITDYLNTFGETEVNAREVTLTVLRHRKSSAVRLTEELDRLAFPRRDYLWD